MKLQLQANTIWVASQPVDFRKAINGLCVEVIDHLKKDPSDGIYIFYNRGRNKIKIIAWHRNGYMMIYKRFEKEKVKIEINTDQSSISMDERQLSWLLAGLPWQMMREEDTIRYNEYH